MVTSCWAAKGGAGTTVVTTLLALESPRPALLIDLAGDVPAVLGLPEPERPGVADWLSGDGPAAQLDDLLVDVDGSTTLLPHRRADLPRGGGASIEPERWSQLSGWCERWQHRHGGDVWIDHGTGEPDPLSPQLDGRRLLVTRACYLALRRAARSPVRPTGIVLLTERGRSLRAADVERALGAPVVASVPVDPQVARAVDAGLLLGRAPFSIRRDLRRVAA